MKALAITLLLVAGAFGLAYVTGIFSMEDPIEAAKQMRSQITQGTTWQQVVDMRPPRKYVYYAPDPKGFGMLRMGPYDYDEAAVKKYASSGSSDASFAFPYRFSATLDTSENDAFDVVFDGNGDFVEFRDIMTTADLLNMAGGGRP